MWCGTYKCKNRESAKQSPCHFNGYDADSLKYLPR